MTNEWFRPRGALARDGWDAVVHPAEVGPGWAHAGLRIATLADGETRDLPVAGVERLVVPLSGSFAVDHEGTATTLVGRRDVFAGPTDVLFLGSQSPATIRALCPGRIAVAEAVATQPRPSVYRAAGDVAVELRGAGRSSRQVHDLAMTNSVDAHALLVCEVITPGGNWSSHPAHKHDVDSPGHETKLEEIYYFEAAPARGLPVAGPGAPFGSFATYTSEAGVIDTSTLVRTGDIALVPFGFHGPAAAAPEYDLYYLNVMAGPRREWLISDDPEQAWVREGWPLAELDPRLPYQGVER